MLAERAALDGMKQISFNTEKSATSIIKPRSLQSVDLTKVTTPEIYLGYYYARAPLGNPQNFQPDQTVSYSVQSTTNFKPNIVYLDGQWKNNRDNMELESNYRKNCFDVLCKVSKHSGIRKRSTRNSYRR